MRDIGLLPECDKYPGRLGDICRGDVYPLANTNKWRSKRGLTPLDVASPTTVDHFAETGAGTKLEAIFNELAAMFDLKMPEVCTCKSIKEEMNRLGPTSCARNKTRLLLAIAANIQSSKLNPKLIETLIDALPTCFDEAVRQAAAELAPVTHTSRPPRRYTIKSVAPCQPCSPAPIAVVAPVAMVSPPSPQGNTQTGLAWAYGLTTVTSRIDSLLPATLASLRATGFDKPMLFIDGCKTPQIYDKFGLEWTARSSNVRTAGNWFLTLYELWIRWPHADRYAIFQDDLVACRNLRAYLERSPYPDHGYQNLYTFPSNATKAKEVGVTKGWFKSNQLGKGAVALVFSNQAAMVLLGRQYMLRRFKDQARGFKAVDGGIVSAMKDAPDIANRWEEYCHVPSLVQHNGFHSSMGNNPQPKANTFKGEDFDALSLL